MNGRGVGLKVADVGVAMMTQTLTLNGCLEKENPHPCGDHHQQDVARDCSELSLILMTIHQGRCQGDGKVQSGEEVRRGQTQMKGALL